MRSRQGEDELGANPEMRRVLPLIRIVVQEGIAEGKKILKWNRGDSNCELKGGIIGIFPMHGHFFRIAARDKGRVPLGK